MGSKIGVMTRKVQVVNAREYRKVAIVERFSVREHKVAPYKYREVHMPLAVAAKQYEYVMRAEALRAIARGKW